MKLFTLATALIVAPAIIGCTANAQIVDLGCETYTNDDALIGQVEFCVKTNEAEVGQYIIDYTDNTFTGKMVAQCYEDATGYHAYNGADETQVEHITRGFCNSLRTEAGQARTMETFAF